ncbi:MAG: oligosaccharide flippase family protein [Firmicutes bacterium]|nr:oligosaccharide flippase family protein [Bacillota bacterium]
MSAPRGTVEGAAPLPARGFSFKALFGDMALYSFGNMLIKGLSLISAPIFTRLFSPGEYGAWSFISAVIAFLTGILLLGGDDAYTRYYFECKSDEERKSLTTTWFLFLAVWSHLVVLALLPFSRAITVMLLEHQIFKLAWITALAFSPAAMLNMLLSQALRNQFKARAFTILNVITAALTLILSVVFALNFRLGITGALLGAGIASLIMIPVRIYSIRGLLTRKLSRAYLKKLLLFGLPLVPVSLAFWLFSNADRIMLIKMDSLEKAGLYAISSSMVAVLSLLHNAVGQSWQPHAIKLYEEDREKAKAVFSRTMTYLTAGAGLAVVAFVALSQEVLYILVPPAYYASFQPIPYLALGIMFFMTAQVTVVGILVHNKTLYIMIACWIFALVNVVLNYFLIPHWGIAGAGAATGISYFLFTLSYLFLSQKLWPVPYDWGNLALLLLISIAATAMIVLVEAAIEGLWICLAVKLFLVFLAALAMLFLMNRSGYIDAGAICSSLLSRIKS